MKTARMLALIMTVLLLFTTSSEARSFRELRHYYAKSWSKTTGWCFKPMKKKWLKPVHICMPRRWGAFDLYITVQIPLNKHARLLLGHQFTYSRYRYEYLKAKEETGHGPYVNFRWRF